ncbi:MAG: class I SAM-dependent methyltransferase [Candidatus Buchananbacteria bacterium]
MLIWDNFFEEKLKIIATQKNILDVGGGIKFQKALGQYQDLFKNSNYQTLDNVAEYQPDILGDITNISLPDSQTDAVICKAVLEHVKDPFKAALEIKRILKPSGQCLGYVPFLYPMHAEKGKYGDYWRFTEQGIKELFKDFSQCEICFVRGSLETVVYLLPNYYLRKIFSPLARIVDNVFKTKNQPSGYYFFVTK